MLRNSDSSYGLLSKTLHWIIGLAILGLLAVGFYMEPLEPDPFKFQLYGWHKSFGILVLLLFALRLAWTTTNAKVKSLDSHQKWEKFLAKAAHVLLYVLMFAMPLSGWLMSSAGGHPVKLFGLELPALMEKNKELGGLFNQSHTMIAYALLVVVGLHVAGAFKHHFFDKDETLQRMTFDKLGFIGGAGLALIVAVLLGSSVYLVLF